MRVPSWVPISTVVVGSVGAVYCIYRAVAAWRGWPPPRIELGNLSEAVGAAATFAAVVVALIIAGRDRRERARERRDEELTRARLVRLTVSGDTSRPTVSVKVRNFGPLPVLDVRLVDAKHCGHSGASWGPVTTNWQSSRQAWEMLERPILMPNDNLKDKYSTIAEFAVLFMDQEGGWIGEVNPRTADYQTPSWMPIDVTTVVLTIHFTTADGVRWSVLTTGPGAGEPVRLGNSSEQGSAR